MDQNSSISNSKNKKKLPKAFFIFFILFVMTEIMISHYGPKITSNPTYRRILAKKQLAKETSDKKTLLILGDSSASGAAIPRIIEEKTGLKAFNFGLIADATVAGDYFMLKEYLRNNESPEYILVIHVYDMWWRKAKDKSVFKVLYRNFQPNFIHYTTKRKKFMSLPMISNFAHLMLPSSSYRYDIQRAIHNIPFTPSAWNSALSRNKTYIKNVDKLDGVTVFGEFHKDVVHQDSKKHVAWMKTQNFSVSAINRYYINRLIKISASKNIKVFLALPPVYRNFYKNAKKTKYYQDYEKYLNTLAEENEHVILLTKDHILVGHDDLSNRVDHTNPKGSEKYSYKISKLIAEYLQNTQSHSVLSK